MSTVVLDLDGTLIDSAPDLHAALCRILEARGRRSVSLDEARLFIGDGARLLVSRAFDATGGPGDLDRATGEFVADYTKNCTERTVVYPGIRESLETLRERGFALVVCTNKPGAPTRAILSGLGLDRLILASVGGDETPARKPHPEHVLAALGGRVGAAMVGDGPNDVASGRAAGLPVIGAAWGYSGRAGLAGADLILDRPDQLPEAVYLSLAP